MSYANIYCYLLHSRTPDYGVGCRFDMEPLGDKEGFVSLYKVDRQTAEAIHTEGTAKYFKGIVWSERLWLDVDSYEAADDVDGKLREMGYDFIAYDTGGRGAHFGVLRATYPSHLLPLKDKAWVKEHFPQADASIYTHLHPFRLPGTVHEKTGRKKEEVVHVTGKAIILPVFKDAKLEDTSNATYFGNYRSVFRCFRVMSNSHAVPEGQRHETLVKLVYALKDDAGVGPGFALDWVHEVNKQYSAPKSDDELEHIVRSIYNGQ